MKSLNGVKKYKRLIAILVIFLLTAGVELGFNFSAIRNGQMVEDLSANVQSIGENDDKAYKISYSSEEGVYVKQLYISGVFPKKASYTIKTVEVNPFGQEEEHEYKDIVHPYFSDFYTNINKTIRQMEIVIPQHEGTILRTVTISDEPEVNIYRVLFFLIVFSVGYCVFFEKGFCSKIEYFFALCTMLFGLLLMVSAQPLRNSWDEQNHFTAAYRLASGKTIQWTEALDFLGEAQSLKCNTQEEYAQLRHVMNEKGKEVTAEQEKTGIGIDNTSLAYVPMALFLKLGMMLGFSFANLYLFGKIGNLLAYVLVMFWTIRMAKGKKLFLAFIAMMPTSVFLAASYTYDSVAFSFVTLGSVILGNELFYAKEPCKKRRIVAALVFIVVGSLAKLVYMPLVLAFLVLPKCTELLKKYRKILLWGGIAGIILIALVIVGPIVKNVLSGVLDFSDNRGGDTSMALQLMSMLTHPLESIRLLVREILCLDNFRNTGSASMDNFLAGNLMFLNFHQWGVLGDKWSFLLVPTIVVLLLMRDENERRNIGFWKKSFLVCLLLAAVVLIWLVMYLAFTPVGNNGIEGVQPRYYLPLLYFAALLLENKRFYICGKYQDAAKGAMKVAVILQSVAVYQLALAGRLF